VQTKTQSIIETTIQVVSDTAINTFVAAPLAYFFYGVKSKVIIELIIIMTLINFGKTYVIRRYYNQEDKRHKFKSAMRSAQRKNYQYTGINQKSLGKYRSSN
jgi:hypothetical protein